MIKNRNLTGQTFGRLTVLYELPHNKDNRRVWMCACTCGEQKQVLEKSLLSGHTKSCGCLAKEINSKRSLVDLTGVRFGRLVVKDRDNDYISPTGKHHVKWLCQCDCGNEISVDVCQLNSGKTKSCGCLKNEVCERGNVTHGGRYDRLYKVWSNMKNRCYNKNSADYKYYGARGISLCDEWRNDYQSFKNWAYSAGYDDNAQKGKCTIDRIDVNGNYEPGNCRWVDMSIQAANRRCVKNKND